MYIYIYIYIYVYLYVYVSAVNTDVCSVTSKPT